VDLFCIQSAFNLDVSNKTALELLYCSRISSLPGSLNDSSLQQLSCERNLLISLDVTNNKELALLDCSDNRLTSLITSNNSELWLLDCSYNQIASLDVTNNTKVYQFLSMEYRHLQGFAFGNCHSLLKLT
jgi:Leucine-rich repeat (LRR) protein